MAEVGSVIQVGADSLLGWQRIVSGSFVPLQVMSDAPDTFRARMRGRVVEDVFFSEIGVERHSVDRSERLIEESPQDFYKLTLQLSGTGLLVQDGKEAVLRPGDIGLYDTSRPYTLTFDEAMRAVVVMFPHALLDVDPEEISRITAVRLAGDNGLARAVSPFLREIARTMTELDGSTGLRVVHTTIDVISTLLVNELTQLADGSRSRSGELLHGIYEYIARNLADPGLGPQSIAQANYISTRYLQQIFTKQGTTISDWIRERRLSYIRRDLADPRLAHRSISQIAAAWGFPNAAHFSKTFRQVAGETASEYRARVARAIPTA